MSTLGLFILVFFSCYGLVTMARDLFRTIFFGRNLKSSLLVWPVKEGADIELEAMNLHNLASEYGCGNAVLLCDDVEKARALRPDWGIDVCRSDELAEYISFKGL